jgi:hypothetical protein
MTLKMIKVWRLLKGKRRQKWPLLAGRLKKVSVVAISTCPSPHDLSLFAPVASGASLSHPLSPGGVVIGSNLKNMDVPKLKVLPFCLFTFSLLYSLSHSNILTLTSFLKPLWRKMKVSERKPKD